MNQLLTFLELQRLLVIASSDGEPWTANVFYGIDKDFKMYFISNLKTKHSQQILKNPTIAFNVAWYDLRNCKNRKAVQGKGYMPSREKPERN